MTVAARLAVKLFAETVAVTVYRPEGVFRPTAQVTTAGFCRVSWVVGHTMPGGLDEKVRVPSRGISKVTVAVSIDGGDVTPGLNTTEVITGACGDGEQGTTMAITRMC